MRVFLEHMESREGRRKLKMHSPIETLIWTVLLGFSLVGVWDISDAWAQKRTRARPMKVKPKPVRAKPKPVRTVEPITRTIKGYLPGALKRTEITFEVIGKDAVFDGDIILGSVDKVEQRLRRPNLPPAEFKKWKVLQKKGAHARMAVRAGGDFLWPGGRIPFVIDLKSYGVHADAARLRIFKAISMLNADTNLNVVPKKKSDKNYIRLKDSDRCMSPVGMQGGKIIKFSQTIHAGFDCSIGSIAHEILHSAGFWHTQSRKDRDNHIKVRYKNVKFGKEGNFFKIGDSIGNYMIFTVGKIVNVPYDIKSIMHYGSCAFAKSDKCGSDLKKATIVTKAGGRIHANRKNLSASDIKAINMVYPKNAGNWQPDLTPPGPMRFDGLWGTWAAKTSSCPPGQFAYAFRQRVEPPQGEGFCGKRLFGKRECKNDDTALNAIQLRCRKKNATSGGIIKSKEAPWGKWTGWRACPTGQFLNGFSIRYEEKQGSKADDSAANNIEFSCTNGGKLKAQGGPWGRWSPYRQCPGAQYIRGFRTRVENKQGSRRDDTALNGVEFKCLGFNQSIPKTYVCPEGKRDGLKNCKVSTFKLKSPCIPGKKGCPYWIDTKYNGIYKKARRSGRRYVCDEGVRSGRRNCRIAKVNFKVKQPRRCRSKQGANVPRAGCTYWLDSRHNGVFRRATFNPNSDGVKFVYKWYGTAPVCKGRKIDCEKRGMEYVRSSKTGGGNTCWFGEKVLCRKPK